MMWSEKLSAYSVCLPLTLSLTLSLSLSLSACSCHLMMHSFIQRPRQMRLSAAAMNQRECECVCKVAYLGREREWGRVGNMGVAAVLTCCSFDCSFIMPMPGAGSLKELCHKLTLAKMSFVCIWQTRCLISHVACSVLPAACCMCCCLLPALAWLLCCLPFELDYIYIADSCLFFTQTTPQPPPQSQSQSPSLLGLLA